MRYGPATPPEPEHRMQQARASRPDEARSPDRAVTKGSTEETLAA